MKRLAVLLAFLAAALSSAFPAQAQTGGGSPISYLYCYISGSPTSPASWGPCDSGNPLPISGDITASLGAFAPAGQYATLAVTNSSGNVALPTGDTVLVYNTGAHNAFVTLGTSNAVTATTSEDVISAGCYATYTVGLNTYLAAITASSTTSLILSGGTGLPAAGCSPNVTISGAAVYGPTAGGSAAANPPVIIGGTVDGTTTGNVDNWKVAGGLGYVSAIVPSGGIASGAIASGAVASGAVASGAYASGSISDGAEVTLGAKADAKSTATDTTAITLMQVSKEISFQAQAIAVSAATIATNTAGPYPAGATPLTASATGTTGATTATLAGTSGKTTYICGYSIRANATGAATVTDTITGVITATLSSILWVAPAASGIGIDENTFTPCVPASGTNQAIAVVSGAPGSGGTVSSRAWGYQL